MINLIRKTFIKNYKDIDDKNVRLSHGILASIVGIITNLIVFLIKIIIGIISFSISIISDAINNLSDMASSIVSLFGFKLSLKKPDEDHPFGHERIEYISGLIVSFIIIIVGIVLIITSIFKIINYDDSSFDNNLFIINVIILAIAILIKMYQAYFYYRISKLISSISLKANFKDSSNDVIVTSTVLIALIVEYILNKNNINIPFSLDGILGIIVSLFIIYTGIDLMKEEINPLIGTKINKKYIDLVIEEIKKYPLVLNYHDIMCHTYGENKCYMTIHLEFDENNNLKDIHNIVDEIEENIKNKYNIELTTHVDPINTNDEEINNIKKILNDYIKEKNYNINFHDIRIIRRENASLLLFDVLEPFDFDKNIEEEIKLLFENKYELKINIDHPYY